MYLEHKTLALGTLELKGAGFIGLASERALDLGGDAMTDRAYDRTLARFKAGATIPLMLDHKRGTLDVVGKVSALRVLSHGLEATFEWIADDPTADAARRRVESGAVNGLSIGYQIHGVRQPTSGERARGVRRVLDDIDVVEISLVTSPMNPRAVVLRTTGKAGPSLAPLPPRWDQPMPPVRRAALSATLARVLDAGKLKPADCQRLEAQLRRLRQRRDGRILDRITRVRARSA